MKTKYIVLFDDIVETYCATLNAAKKTIDEMVEDYCCEGLSEKKLRQDVEVYEVKKIILGGK